jgi:hypothetical protein
MNKTELLNETLRLNNLIEECDDIIKLSNNWLYVNLAKYLKSRLNKKLRLMIFKYNE